MFVIEEGGRRFELDCAFEEEAANPHGKIVQAQTLEWMRRYRLDELAPMSGLDQVGLLCAEVYPRASVDVLQVASDWATLFFLLDDLSEKMTASSLLMRHQALMRVVLGGGGDDGISRALADVMARLRGLASPPWVKHFAIEVGRWLSSHVWEALNREQDRVPPIHEYLQMRQWTIGMYPCFLLAELADGISEGGDYVVAHAASRQIALANDLLTYRKEMSASDVHNAVISLCRGPDDRMPIADAVAKVVKLHNDAVEVFTDERERAPEFARALQSWMSGHLRWGFRSRRYDLVGDLPR